MANFSGREFFTADEFNHPDKMTNRLLSMLDMARREAGVIFEVTSDWRVEGDGKSHHLGNAVDISAKTSSDRGAVIRGAVLAGFTRIGVYYAVIEEGHHKYGHVHMDCNSVDDGFPQNVMWIGKSRR